MTELIAISVIGVGTLGFVAQLATWLKGKGWPVQIVKLCLLIATFLVALSNVNLAIHFAEDGSLDQAIIDGLGIVYQLLIWLMVLFSIYLVVMFIVKLISPETFNYVITGEKNNPFKGK